MPALKEKAISLLGSAAINCADADKASGPYTIFTVPLGKLARITHVVVRNPTASMAGGTDFKFGTGFRNNAAVDLSSLTTLGTDYIVLGNATAAGLDQKCTEIAAATAVQVDVDTGTTVACTATFDVFGFLADA